MSDENDMIRRGDVLAIVKPDGARDCDCTRCTCGDEVEVSLWDQSKRYSDTIAALPAVAVGVTNEDIDALVYRFWSIHPKDIPEPVGMPDGYKGGKRAWFYATEIRRIFAALTPAPAVDVKGLVEALRWYGEQSRLARLIHSEGDAGRHAIAADGGKRAAAALAAFEKENGK